MSMSESIQLRIVTLHLALMKNGAKHLSRPPPIHHPSHRNTKGKPGLYDKHRFLMATFPAWGHPGGGRFPSINAGASEGTSLYSWMRSTARGGKKDGRRKEEIEQNQKGYSSSRCG